jgi:hypothetical protein
MLSREYCLEKAGECESKAAELSEPWRSSWLQMAADWRTAADTVALHQGHDLYANDDFLRPPDWDRGD